MQQWRNGIRMRLKISGPVMGLGVQISPAALKSFVRKDLRVRFPLPAINCMKIEKTATYWRIFIGRHYISYVYPDKGLKAACTIIRLEPNMDTEQLRQIIAYLQACYKERG